MGKESFLLPEVDDDKKVENNQAQISATDNARDPSSGNVKKEISYWRDRLTFSDLSESFRLAIQEQKK